MSAPTTRNAIWAESGQTTAPSQGEQQSGYVAGKPSRRKTNWILNWIDNAIQWILTMGIPVYASDAVYPPKACCQDSSGNTWQRIGSGDTTGTAPSEGEYWTRRGHTPAQIGSIVDGKFGTLSGDVSDDVSASDGATVVSADTFNFPNTTYKIIAIQLTVPCDGTGATTITLSGDAQFYTELLTMTTSIGPAISGQPYAFVEKASNSTVSVTVVSVSGDTVDIGLFLAGH